MPPPLNRQASPPVAQHEEQPEEQHEEEQHEDPRRIVHLEHELARTRHELAVARHTEPRHPITYVMFSSQLTIYLRLGLRADSPRTQGRRYSRFVSLFDGIHAHLADQEHILALEGMEPDERAATIAQDRRGKSAKEIADYELKCVNSILPW